jgi:hypothetical protein|tara:strand:+ start:241 stop:513 length:273 start_codon:yes stop_codon:yes gene_type:complete
MKIFNWLFGKGWDAPADDVPHEFHEVLDDRKFQPVPKWTHAGKAGKMIYCPKCGVPGRVYNFAWSALVCNACATVIEKYEWLMPVKKRTK